MAIVGKGRESEFLEDDMRLFIMSRTNLQLDEMTIYLYVFLYLLVCLDESSFCIWNLKGYQTRLQR
jgi:hypothetical protein